MNVTNYRAERRAAHGSRTRTRRSPTRNSPAGRAGNGFVLIGSLLAYLALCGCANSNSVADPELAQVTGQISYRERIALPPSTIVRVQLVDVSRADAPAIVLGEQTFVTAGRQVPLSFTIDYERARIQTNLSYALEARIELGGRLLFITDQHYPVLTRDAPDHAEMLLKAVQEPAEPDIP